MRKLVLYELLSLDGVAEAPETFVADFEAEMNADLAAAIGTQDAVLLGRGTYDEWAGYWPTSTEQPFAAFINRVQKYVMTSTPLVKTWSNTSVIDRSATDHIHTLKSEPGGDIGVHGSILLAQSLLSAGLVDEVRLVVVPSVVGVGRRLFDGLGAPVNLEQIYSTTTPGGALLVGYRVAKPGHRTA